MIETNNKGNAKTYNLNASKQRRITTSGAWERVSLYFDSFSKIRNVVQQPHLLYFYFVPLVFSVSRGKEL